MKGAIAWFVKNPVAANLMMLIIIVGGLFSAFGLDNQMFPNITPNMVSVTMPYPGAGPLEVEEQIVMRIEEAVSDVEGIYEVTSVASQGLGTVTIEAVENWDLQRLLNDVKSKVDAINTFPEDAERPIVAEEVRHDRVMDLAVSGNVSERVLKDLVEDIREDISRLPGVTQVETNGIRESEVSVEIPEETLRAYNLRFEDIVAAIRAHSINLPAGQIRHDLGDIQIQTYGQAYEAGDFEKIVVVRNVDGSQVLLGDIATIRDGFQDVNYALEFNGRPAGGIQVFVGDHPDFFGATEVIRRYVAQKRPSLPEGVELTIWQARAVYLQDRLDLLLKNAVQGLALVFLMLMLFLRPALSLWVTAGIAVAYLGTIWVMPAVGLPLSVISTFAFLMILGIIVDDAIVVGESIYLEYERGTPGSLAAIQGTRTVAKPVTYAVLTTMVVFFPMLFMPGNMADMMTPFPIVAISALSFSLLESFYILPNHLSHLKPEGAPRGAISRSVRSMRHRVSRGLSRFSENYYLPLVRRALNNKPMVLATYVVALAILFAIVAGGWLRISRFPDIEGERVSATVELQEGTGFSQTRKAKRQLVAALEKVKQSGELVGYSGQPAIENTFTVIYGNTIRMYLGLISNEERGIGSRTIAEKWKRTVGKIEKAESLEINSGIGHGSNKDISLRLMGPDTDELEQATTELTEVLSSYPGVYNVGDSLSSMRREIRLKLKPYAETLGIGLADIARQVRYAYYGAEAQRIPRLREDVRVLVRYPKADRTKLDTLEDMRIRTPDGREVPFSAVAESQFVQGYTTIQRVNRQRTVSVEAEVLESEADSNQVTEGIFGLEWPKIHSRHPGVTLDVAGQQKEWGEFMRAMAVGFVFSMLFIYALLAVEFHSYWQPLVVLSAIPFGIGGAILGHLLTGYHLSMPSFFGIMATAGVVVNDNLVLLDRINNLRKAGAPLREAVERGAHDRLRPILLTSLTTFFGLTPILLETSISAKFLQPMVVSLAFGVLLATTVTLILVPVCYTLGEETKRRLGFRSRAEIDVPTESAGEFPD